MASTSRARAHSPTLSLCQQLVRLSSVTGEERAVADFIVKFCRQHKLRYKRLADSVVILPAARRHKNALIFYAHTDTVPAGDVSSWRHSPLSAKTANGKLYGLGASDDKAAAACLMQTALELRQANTPSDVYFLFAQGEEKDGIGAQNFVKWFSTLRYSQAWAIIGEPTDLKTVELGCRGSLFIRFNLHGQSYHGADTQRKNDDALSKALLVPPLILRLQKQAQRQHTHPVLGPPTIALTGLQSGERANKLPDTARLTLDVRTTPGFHAKTISSIRAILSRAGLKTKLEISNRLLAPYLTPASSPFAKQMTRLTGARAGVSRGSNDCAFFIAAGIPAVSFGPGVKACIHQQDEYVPLSHLSRGVQIYKKLALQLRPSKS